ncbi:hypothetical protein VTJ04DRAFT_4758 [Mycothermus thermophilus]|uniref:uncharacterized protein n=1 Tax=Humicola insolens TaxID=85995 RepID=UPI003742CC66
MPGATPQAWVPKGCTSVAVVCVTLSGSTASRPDSLLRRYSDSLLRSPPVRPDRITLLCRGPPLDISQSVEPLASHRNTGPTFAAALHAGASSQSMEPLAREQASAQRPTLDVIGRSGWYAVFTEYMMTDWLHS